MPYGAIAGLAVLGLLLVFLFKGEYSLTEKVSVGALYGLSYLLTGHPILVIILRTAVGIYLCVRIGVHERQRGLL